MADPFLDGLHAALTVLAWAAGAAVALTPVALLAWGATVTARWGRTRRVERRVRRRTR